tara:strand:- start:761 stop:1222 length:462 start_codon:yes stop_codon:yes gene_type:complete
MSNNLYEANLGCYKLKENAKLPTKGSHHAACYDLYSCSDAPIVIDPKERMLIPIGLVLDIPHGFSARIHTRSGMAAKKGIGLSVSQGIIDSDYVEEVFVPMVNNTNKSFSIHPGDRIAQLELVREIVADVYETQERPEQKTNRDGGFGSTGVK